MRKQLKQCMLGQEWICIYEGGDHEAFIFGKVVHMDDRYCIIRRVAPDGSDDGLLLLETDGIFRIETDSKYIRKMQRIMGTARRETPYDLDAYFRGESSCRTALLRFAKDGDRVLSIELLSGGVTDIMGRVQSVSEDGIAVRQIDEYGEDDGLSVCRPGDITQISIDSEAERIIEKLLTPQREDLPADDGTAASAPTAEDPGFEQADPAVIQPPEDPPVAVPAAAPEAPNPFVWDTIPEAEVGWTCPHCLTINAADADVCACCGQGRPAAEHTVTVPVLGKTDRTEEKSFREVLEYAEKFTTETGMKGYLSRVKEHLPKEDRTKIDSLLGLTKSGMREEIKRMKTEA